MPVLRFSKSALGAVVDVGLLPATRQLNSKPAWPIPPSSVPLKMLIDTGADYTAVDVRKIARWGLTPSTWYPSQTMGGTSNVDVYDLHLTILDGPGGQSFWDIDQLPVSARLNSPFHGMPYAGVIGRDVLDRGTFFYGGSVGRCRLRY